MRLIIDRCFTNRLVEVGMVSPQLIRTMQLPSRDNYDKATELVSQVTIEVESCPEKYHIFMRVLEEFQWLYLVQEQYKANKENEVKEGLGIYFALHFTVTLLCSQLQLGIVLHPK